MTDDEDGNNLGRTCKGTGYKFSNSDIIRFNINGHH